ncbi:MAG TPA: hypothetical protein VEK06_00335 [Myxococcota bacterium]|nr:hypothetical protein [Myxococcota bacterium]
MHLAVSYSAPGNAPRAIKNLSDCEELFGPEVHKGQKAAELYKKAFQLSFFGTAAQARLASECSCLLKNGGTRWAYETSDLIKGIANIEP